MKLERILSLILVLQNHPSGLTRNEIIKTRLYNFYFENIEKIEDEASLKNAIRLFESDKKYLEELGFEIQVLENKYFLSNSPTRKNRMILNNNEKELIANHLLKSIHKNNKNNKRKAKYSNIYIKLFFNDENYIKKLTNNQYNIKPKLNIESYLENYSLINPEIYYSITDIIFKKKPLHITYQKKNLEIIQRTIFPLFFYKNIYLIYLVSYDYEKQDIRNYLLNQIIRFQEIENSKEIKPIKIVKNLKKNFKHNKYIYLSYKTIKEKIPHPFNIVDDSIEDNIKKQLITLEIDINFYDIYRKYLKDQNKFHIDYSIYDKSTKSFKIQLKVKNLQAIYYFISQYPSSIINIEPQEIKENYKKFTEKIIKFYQNTKVQA